MSRRLVITAALSSLAPAVACTDEGGAVMAPDAAVPPPVFRPDARVSPDAAPLPDGVLSNLPDLVWQQGFTAVPEIVLVSSNLQQETAAGAVVQVWYAELRNVGSRILCDPEVTLRIADSGGVARIQLSGDADADPYQETASAVAASECMGPGGTAALSAIARPAAAVDLADLRAAQYVVTARDLPTARPHPVAPSVSGRQTGPASGPWAVSGSVLAGDGELSSITLHAYPVGAGGWIVGALSAVDNRIGGFRSWSYQTTTTRQRFDRFHTFVTFIGRSDAAGGVR